MNAVGGGVDFGTVGAGTVPPGAPSFPGDDDDPFLDDVAALQSITSEDEAFTFFVDYFTSQPLLRGELERIVIADAVECPMGWNTKAATTETLYFSLNVNFQLMCNNDVTQTSGKDGCTLAELMLDDPERFIGAAERAAVRAQ